MRYCKITATFGGFTQKLKNKSYSLRLQFRNKPQNDIFFPRKNLNHFLIFVQLKFAIDFLVCLGSCKTSSTRQITVNLSTRLHKQ